MLLPKLLTGSFGLIFSGLCQAHIMLLSDSELSSIHGQALFSLTQSTGTSPVDNSNLGFYKFAAEAAIDINANIKSLQLGCGGVNGANGCDIDIQNLSISGVNDGTDSTGSPTFSKGRTTTDAKITNPFIEFAIKNPSNLSTREMVGFRLGAEKILGLLTLGTDNSSDPVDGIRSFSGYMRTAQTTGKAYTKQTTFSDAANQGLHPPATLIATIFGTDYQREFTSDTTDANNTGITLPSSPATFTLGSQLVSGTRKTNLVINNITANTALVPLAAGSGVAGVDDNLFTNDRLFVRFDAILGLVSSAKYKPANGSVMRNLDINVTSLTQNLSAIHNIPLNGSGGYLSFQKENVKWNGANSDDIAQRGWWLSVKDPVELGQLVAKEQIDIDSLLPQIADIVSDYLKDHPVRTEGSSVNAAFGGDTTSVLDLDFAGRSYTQPSIALGSQVFQSQNIAPNCYGNLRFC